MAPTAVELLAKEIEDELMKYTEKYDHKMEADLVMNTNESQKNSDVDVDITECTTSLSNELLPTELLDATETSSSFGDCNSDDGNVDTLGCSEALSGIHGDAAWALEFDRFGRMRRKKLTTHWRSHIRPLKWRCKWIELQIKKLQSHAWKYDRELQAYNDKKWIKQYNSTTADGSRSLPFSRTNDKIDVIKRKKRRQDEATTDLTAYVSHHNIFSYCYENRKCFAEVPYPCKELKNPDNQTDEEVMLDDDDEPLYFNGGDDYHSLVQILTKIEFLQSEVALMKSKLRSIAGDIIDEFFSVVENSDMPPPKHSENGTEGARIAYRSTGPRSGATSCLDVPGTSGCKGPACVEAYKRSLQVEDGVVIDKEEIYSFGQLNTQQTPWDDDGAPTKVHPTAYRRSKRGRRSKTRRFKLG